MKHIRLVNIVVALLMLAALLPLSPQTVKAESTQPRTISHDVKAKFVPGEVLVVFKSDVPKAEYASRAQALAGNIHATVKKQRGDMALLKMDESIDVYATADKIAQDPTIEFAEPNYIYGHDTGPEPPNPNNPTPPPAKRRGEGNEGQEGSPQSPDVP